MSEEHLDSVKLELEEKEREKSDLGELNWIFSEWKNVWN